MNVHGSPEWVAAQYTSVSNSVNHSWSDIGYWAVLVQPYVTQSYGSKLSAAGAAAKAAAAAGNGSSADAHLWQVVETSQEDIGAQVASSLVISEAGVTPTSEIVRVRWYPTILTKQSRDVGATPQVNGSLQRADDYMTKVGGTWEVASVASATEGG